MASFCSFKDEQNRIGITHTHTHTRERKREREREREREYLLGYLAFTDLEVTLAFAVTALSQIDHVICFFIAATAAYNQNFLIHVS